MQPYKDWLALKTKNEVLSGDLLVGGDTFSVIMQINEDQLTVPTLGKPPGLEVRVKLPHPLSPKGQHRFVQ